MQGVACLSGAGRGLAGEGSWSRPLFTNGVEEDTVPGQDDPVLVPDVGVGATQLHDGNGIGQAQSIVVCTRIFPELDIRFHALGKEARFGANPTAEFDLFPTDNQVLADQGPCLIFADGDSRIIQHGFYFPLSDDAGVSSWFANVACHSRNRGQQIDEDEQDPMEVP